MYCPVLRCHQKSGSLIGLAAAANIMIIKNKTTSRVTSVNDRGIRGSISLAVISSERTGETVFTECDMYSIGKRTGQLDFIVAPGCGSVTLAAAATHNQKNNSGEYYQGHATMFIGLSSIACILLISENCWNAICLYSIDSRSVNAFSIAKLSTWLDFRVGFCHNCSHMSTPLSSANH